MKVEEAYTVLQKESGIGIGDKVRVLRRFKGSEMGCESTGWNSCNTKARFVDDKAVGIIDGIQSRYLLVSMGSEYRSDTWSFPFFVLEVIEKAKTITKVVTFIDETGKDVTDQISAETKRNLG